MRAFCVRPAPAAPGPGRLGRRSFGFGGVEVSAVRGCGLLDGGGQRAGLLNHHDVIFAVLTKVKFGEVKAFDARSLKLKEDRLSVSKDEYNGKQFTTFC